MKPHGVTLRHFPQSFQHSTLGGWIATRSGGHFATLYTHIDDLVESVTCVTPVGRMESRRLPGSGAGPSPDRLVLGSEGSLGIITEAWVRLQGRVAFKAAAGFRFPDFLQAAGAVRAIAQAGLFPANVRIVDGVELQVNGAGDGSFTLMVVSFESADHPVEAWMDRAEQCARDYGGPARCRLAHQPRRPPPRSGRRAWRDAFIKMPYNREVLTPRNIISDTFESAITWDRFESFYHAVRDATREAIREATGQEGAVSCRFSHAYPDGPAPYFAFHCAADPGSMLEQWRDIKRAVSDAVIDNGGTITHHHAIGRDHQPWYEKQRPQLFGDVLARAKAHLTRRESSTQGVLVPEGSPLKTLGPRPNRVGTLPRARLSRRLEKAATRGDMRFEIGKALYMPHRCLNGGYHRLPDAVLDRPYRSEVRSAVQEMNSASSRVSLNPTAASINSSGSIGGHIGACVAGVVTPPELRHPPDRDPVVTEEPGQRRIHLGAVRGEGSNRPHVEFLQGRHNRGGGNGGRAIKQPMDTPRDIGVTAGSADKRDGGVDVGGGLGSGQHGDGRPHPRGRQTPLEP